IVEARGHVSKTVDRIPGEIDGVEFDMGNRVHQRCPAFNRPQSTFGKGARLDQERTMGTPRIRNEVRKVAGFSVRQVTGSILGSKLVRHSALQPRLGSLEASSRSAVQIDVVHDSFGPEWIVARA